MANWSSDARYTSCPDPNLLQDPAWQNGLDALFDGGWVCEIMALPSQYEMIAALAAKFPHGQFIIGHAGMPYDPSVEGLKVWSKAMSVLSEFLNIAVKISGFAMFLHGSRRETERDITRTLVDLFGPSRCMVGSNFAIDALHTGFDDVFDTIEDSISVLNEGDIAAILAGTAQRIFQL
jgi:predicted TIM-barrel fold metal-dependent hydrolase